MMASAIVEQASQSAFVRPVKLSRPQFTVASFVRFAPKSCHSLLPAPIPKAVIRSLRGPKTVSNYQPATRMTSSRQPGSNPARQVATQVTCAAISGV